MKILWVSNHSPFQTDFGGGQRSNLIYRTLREIADVDVLLIARDQVPGDPKEFYGTGDGRLEVVRATTRGERFPWALARPVAPGPVDRLAYNLGRRQIDYSPNPAVAAAAQRMARDAKYDLYVGRHLRNSGQAGLLRCRRAIVDVDDNELELFRRIIDDPATSAIRRQVLKRRVRTLESLLPRLLAGDLHLWVTKEEDLSKPGFARARVLPNIPYVLANEAEVDHVQPYSAYQTVLFVGMLSYLYNVQGLDWFLSNVWPTVRTRVPAATFRIVGSRLHDHDRRRWSAVPGVEVTGFVEDLAAAYSGCRMVVVPVWSGGGTNIKILEALVHGRPCVLTSSAFGGFAGKLNEGEAVLVADRADQMIEQCVELLENDAKCIEMGARGAAAVVQHYPFSAFRDIVLQTVYEAMDSQVPARLSTTVPIGSG